MTALWTCRICGKKNQATDEKCVACGRARNHDTKKFEAYGETLKEQWPGQLYTGSEYAASAKAHPNFSSPKKNSPLSLSKEEKLAQAKEKLEQARAEARYDRARNQDEFEGEDDDPHAHAFYILTDKCFFPIKMK